MKSLIALLALLFVYGAATKFNAFGELYCEHPGPWCATVDLIELDNGEITHDMIDNAAFQCMQERVDLRYDLKGEQSWDGPMNNFWELGVRVKHNCTCDNKYKEFWYHLPLEPVTEEEIKFEWSQGITDKGIYTDAAVN